MEPVHLLVQPHADVRDATMGLVDGGEGVAPRVHPSDSKGPVRSLLDLDGNGDRKERSATANDQSMAGREEERGM